MGTRPPGSRTWILAGLWAVAIAFAIAVAVAAEDGGSSLVSKLLAGLGALATLISLARDIWLGERSRARDEKSSADGSPAHHADQLAIAVMNTWEAEARVRRLRTPWLLPVPWQAADASLASVPDVVFRSPETGHIMPERERGPMRGDVGTLADLYAKLPRHRLVVLGPPGSGKSVVVIEMTLALLRRRRPGGPVPVPLQLASWDPDTDLNDWLVQALIENYSFTSDGRRSPQTVARELVDDGLVLAILDSFDEIDKDRRRAAVGQLNLSLAEEQPLVLTCRTDDYRATVQAATVVATSFAVELQPLDDGTAQEYLTAASPGGDATIAWSEVFAEIRTHPYGPLAATLRTPLMISLAREIYCEGPHDPRNLLGTGYGTQETIERHLLGQLVPVAYQRKAPKDLVEWSDRRPEAWLRYLATRTGGPNTPNIAWWQFEQGVPPLVVGAIPAVVAATLVAWFIGPAAGVIFGVVALAACATWRGRGWTLETALLRRGAGDGEADKNRQERNARWGALTVGRVLALAAGVGYGYTIYQSHTLYRAAAAAVMFGMAVGLADGFFTISLRTTPTEMRVASYRGLTAFLGRFLIYLAMGAASTATVWIIFHSPYAMLVVAVVFVVFGLIDSVNVWLDVPADVTRALSPQSTCRDERFAAIARSLTIALTLAGVTLTLYGVAGAITDGIVPAIVAGVAYGAADRLMGIATSVWGRYVIAKTWAALWGDVPWRFMLFLDDAHRRGLLRRAGAAHQFRHTRLQQHLAGSSDGDRR
jgi:hypothetical protein